MNQCFECGVEIPEGEEFCCSLHEHIYLRDMHMTPGYTLLDSESSTAISKRGRKKQFDDPPSVPTDYPIDLNELPF